MRLDRAETIAGQPIKRVRDWLRGLRNDCRESAIAKHFALEEPEEFIGALKQRELLVDSDYRDPKSGERYYAPGPAARRFAAASLLRPNNRAKADEILIVAANTDPNARTGLAMP